MAMQATHVRAALELEPLLGVRDRAAYLSGTVYPDSRYVTGAPRSSTHGPDCPRDPFQPGISDFERGWAVHLQYDLLAGAKMKAMLPAGLEVKGLNDGWVYFTALKIIEDEQSIDLLNDFPSWFASLRLEDAPRGEDAILLERYVQLIRRLYARRPKMADYMECLRAFGLPDEVVQTLDDMTNVLLQDLKKTSAVAAVYPKVLARLRLRQIDA